MSAPPFLSRRGSPGGGTDGNRRKNAGPTRARLIAVRVLERVERFRTFANLALDRALAASNLSSVDRALATELVYGTLRWRGFLDYALRNALENELEDMEPLVLTVLRIGAYQLYFCDRIPDRATVDESVRCARGLGAERATGLVNAVLRRVARERTTLTYPALDENPIEHLQHALSLPLWIAQRWLTDYGPERAAELASASNTPGPLAVRVNTTLTNRETLLSDLKQEFRGARASTIASQGIILGRSGNPRTNRRFLSGHYTVQDEASQLIVDLLAPQPGETVLDICAAPGGKATAIAERLSGKGNVLALDRDPNRLRLVGRAARRLQLNGMQMLVRDATQPLNDLPGPDGTVHKRDGARFDRVLVDAPCSGLGTLRRNPDARWRIQPSDPAQLAGLQAQLLRQAAAVVAPRGKLLYSTCTLLQEENEDVIERFLEDHKDFQRSPRHELPSHLDPVLDNDATLRCYPHQQDTDGFFAVRMERLDAT